AYAISNAVRMSGKLDAVALERSLQEVVRRHESLRTTFHAYQGRPMQIIGLSGTFRLPVVELSGLPLERREIEARQLVQQEGQQLFDLARGPLLRARLLRLDEQEHVLLLSMHHII